MACRFAAAPQRVFAAWLDPEIARRWLFATAAHPAERVEVDARVGGSFRVVHRQYGRTVVRTGRYVDIAAGRRLAFDLRLDGADTRVTVDLTPAGIGCTLSLAHHDVPQQLATEVEGRWSGLLHGLGEMLADAEGATSGDEPPDPVPVEPERGPLQTFEDMQR